MNPAPHCTLIPTRLLLTALIVFAQPGWAADYCVSTGAQLTNALAAAHNNGQSDTIKIVEGTLTSGAGNAMDQWSYFPTETDAATALTLIGGYEAGCAGVNPPNDATATVLDGQHRGTTLGISTSKVSDFSGQITVKNLTITRGRASNNGSASGIGLVANNATVSARLELERTLVVGSHSFVAPSGSVKVSIAPAGSARIKGNIVHGNTVVASTGSPGMNVVAGTSAYAVVHNNSIFNNVGNQVGAGMALCGTLTLANNAVAQNTPSGWESTEAQVHTYAGSCTTGLTLRNNHFENYYWIGTPDSEQGTTTGNPQWTISGSFPVANAVSPLRDSGLNNPLTGLTSVDIRGHARIINGTVDRGAVEADVVPATGPTISAVWPVPSDYNSLGTASIGATVTAQMTFIATGGHQGSTTMTCTDNLPHLQITANASQTVLAGQPVQPVSFSIGPVVAGLQSGNITCAISPQGGSPYTLWFGVGVTGVGDAVFDDSFESAP